MKQVSEVGMLTIHCYHNVIITVGFSLKRTTEPVIEEEFFNSSNV